jgi:hypothetical protein
MATRTAAPLLPGGQTKGWYLGAATSSATRPAIAPLSAARMASAAQPAVASSAATHRGLVRELNEDVAPHGLRAAADGIGGSDAEIALVIELRAPREAVNHLIQMALDRGAPDDVSAAGTEVANTEPTHR